MNLHFFKKTEIVKNGKNIRKGSLGSRKSKNRAEKTRNMAKGPVHDIRINFES